MSRTYRILYVGELTSGGTCLSRCEALRELGHQVTAVNTALENGRRSWLSRVSNWAFQLGFDGGGVLDTAGANRKIRELAASQPFDLLWLDKGLTIKAATLKLLKAAQPRCLLAGYSPDDMNQRHSLSGRFLQHLSLYDHYFVTKSFNVAELAARGCKNVHFVENAYDPRLHRPVPVPEAERKGVGFIGGCEMERARSMDYLVRNGIPVAVWGEQWVKLKRQLDAGFEIAGPSLYGEDYVRTICALDINLGFLRKANRDLQTTRSIEIPACGAFMLAERTDEHRALFEEDREAVFFGSDAELLAKAKYYLAHPVERAKIAAAGRERCLKSDYSNQARLQAMLRLVLPK